MEREVKYFPKHFVLVKTAITHESRQWVLESLQGRFCIVTTIDADDGFINLPVEYPAFEDPQEATFYTLKWS